MKKGGVGIAVIVLFAITLIYGIIIHFAIGETESVIRSVRERDIIKLINDMEWNKRAMPQVLEYSFYQSSYSLASKGGYFNPNEAPSYDCIPYWKIYDRIYIPDRDSIKENLDKSFIYYINHYSNALRVSLPEYEISYEEDGENILVAMKSDSNLEMERGIAKVEDESDFSGKFDSNIFKLFERGKDFVEEDKISYVVMSSLGKSCEEIDGSISNEVKQLEDDGMELIVEDVQTDCSGHVAAKILVKISDDTKHPVYDYIENTTEMRSTQLKFYVIAGNSRMISADTNLCEN